VLMVDLSGHLSSPKCINEDLLRSISTTSMISIGRFSHTEKTLPNESMQLPAILVSEMQIIIPTSRKHSRKSIFSSRRLDDARSMASLPSIKDWQSISFVLFDR
jgi:hypothetical protein